MTIRRFRVSDAQPLSLMIAQTLRTSNKKDYSSEYIEQTICALSPQVLRERAEMGHMYVVEQDGEPVGCGAIAGFWGSETESILLTIFVRPDVQGQGVGRRIVETLEADEYFLRASRVEIPASKTAVGFYQKMGYQGKDGLLEPDEEQMVRMEKFR